MSHLQELKDVPLEVNRTIDFDISGPCHLQVEVFIDKQGADEIEEFEQPDFIVDAELLKDNTDIGIEENQRGYPALYLASQPDIDNSIFNDYLNWLYCRQIPLEDRIPFNSKKRQRDDKPTAEPEVEPEDPKYVDLARLYNLAIYLGDTTCQDAVLDTIAAAAKAYGPKRAQYARLPGREAVVVMGVKDRYINDQSMGWLLFLAIYADLASDEDIYGLRHESFKEDLLLYVLRKVKDRRPESFIGQLCQFHHHHGDEECPSRSEEELLEPGEL